MFVGAKDFCPNFPKLARKKLQRNDLQKNDCISSHLGYISKNQSTRQAPFLPKFARKEKKHDIQKQKERPHFAFGCHFYKIRAHAAILRIFSQIFPKFPQILPGV